MDNDNVMRHLRNDNNIKSWVCQFCGEPFPYEVHPEVIRHHLTWKCERAPEDVKEAAQRIEEPEFSISVEGNAQTEASRNAGREVEAAECSRSVHRELTRILDANENIDSNFEAETDSSIVERSNKRQRTTSDALPTVAALEVPNYSFGDDESRSLRKGVLGWLKVKAAMRWELLMRKKFSEWTAQLVELDDSLKAL